jgi:ribonuclease PH
MLFYSQVQYGLVEGASGSARVRIGDTEAVCSLFGPRVENTGASTFSDVGRVQVDVKYCPFAIAANSSASSSPPEAALAERLLEALSCTICLDKYPKCTISVFIVIMQSCGNELGAALTACSQALLDAAIEVTDIIAPCTVTVRDGVAELNSAFLARRPAEVSLTAAYSPSVDAFPHVYLNGRIDPAKLTELFAIARKGSLLMRQELSTIIKEKVLKTVEVNMS